MSSLLNTYTKNAKAELTDRILSVCSKIEAIARACHENDPTYNAERMAFMKTLAAFRNELLGKGIVVAKKPRKKKALTYTIDELLDIWNRYKADGYDESIEVFFAWVKKRESEVAGSTVG